MTIKKRRYFKKGEIVHHGNVFGHVISTEEDVVVRFPKYKDATSGKEIAFHPNGSLFGVGPQIIYHAKDEDINLDDVCRGMTIRVKAVTDKMKKKDIDDFDDDEDPEEDAMF